MADVKKIATRESYGNALKELAEEFPQLVVLDADLAGATKTGIFKKAYPDRHIDCGIAESNMMGIAAGLALTGKIPFASSFAMFAAGRAFEQVRNSIGYPHLNVKIGATHAGITVGEDGASHQCLEDIALMRTIPGMTVIVPADDTEARAAVHAARPALGVMPPLREGGGNAFFRFFSLFVMSLSYYFRSRKQAAVLTHFLQKVATLSIFPLKVTTDHRKIQNIGGFISSYLYCKKWQHRFC